MINVLDFEPACRRDICLLDMDSIKRASLILDTAHTFDPFVSELTTAPNGRLYLPSYILEYYLNFDFLLHIY